MMKGLVPVNLFYQWAGYCKHRWNVKICRIQLCHALNILLLFIGSDEDDSNLLTSEHDVISGVLREEFGPSFDVVYGPRPQTSRCISFDKRIKQWLWYQREKCKLQVCRSLKGWWSKVMVCTGKCVRTSNPISRNDLLLPPQCDDLYTHLRVCGGCGGLMVSALDSGASDPGSSPGRGHCVVFLGKTLSLLSRCLSPPRWINGYRQTYNAGGVTLR